MKKTSPEKNKRFGRIASGLIFALDSGKRDGKLNRKGKNPRKSKWRAKREAILNEARRQLAGGIISHRGQTSEAFFVLFTTISLTIKVGTWVKM